jgi:hypothetical protein
MTILSRLFALLTGLGLMYGAINVAAEIGDIIFAMPMLFLGGLQLLYAITGFYPTRSPFAFWLRRTAERNQLGYSMKQPGGR